MDHIVTFGAGSAYGFSSVIIGQPLDTIKVRMQGLPNASKLSSSKVGRDLFRKEGIRGLYRGGLPLLVGGSLMRSAQFGVSGASKTWLEKNTNNGQPAFWHVVLSGMAGGLGRGIVEIPTDFFKTRRQVEHSNYKFREIFDGSGVTMMRNAGLFSLFMIYIDFSSQLCKKGYVPSALTTEDGHTLSSFPKGAICANLAWLTIWPFDVVKTQRQSGNYTSQTTTQLFQDNFRSGRFFRGIVPGLVRATITNGSSMVLYDYVHSTLSEQLLHEEEH